MQTDELRAELAELAREVDPFPEELTAIRKRVARRRAASLSIAVVLILGLIAGAIATTRSSGDHVRVAGQSKQVAINELSRIDAFVALRKSADLAAVRGILDSTDVVEHYAITPVSAFVPLGRGNDNQLASPALRSFAQTFGRSTILGVQLDRSVADRIHRLAAALGSTAVVKDYGRLKLPRGYGDAEIFMAVKACDDQVDAVRLALSRDPDVESSQFVSKADALKEFRKLFHDEPTLIGNTTAAALPASFKVRLRDGVSPPAFARRYSQLAGVKGVNTAAANPFGSTPSFKPENPDQTACAAKP